MYIFLLFYALACGGKSSSPIKEQPAPEEKIISREAPKKIQNKELLTTGVLDPIPQNAATDFTVRFRTLYPNGCWKQSTHTTTVVQQQITHSYTTKYDGAGKMCTMAMVPGGFEEKMTLEPGKYNGKIMVDDQERANYNIEILGKQP